MYYDQRANSDEELFAVSCGVSGESKVEKESLQSRGGLFGVWNVRHAVQSDESTPNRRKLVQGRSS